MLHDFLPGDFLIFQLESGYGLIRVLAVEKEGDGVWHLAAYEDLFLDPESVDRALQNPADLTIDKRHFALTNRAFESTQVSQMKNVPLGSDELDRVSDWQQDPERQVSDRSIRLMLGLR